MSNKYYGRSVSSINRDNSLTNENNKEPSWFKEFADNFEKSAVKSKKQDASLFDEISSVMGNKSKYSSVEEAVLDMQKRTGLYDLLNKKASLEIFEQIPNMKIFIDNYIEDRPGTSVESVIHDLLKMDAIKNKLPNGMDVSDDVRRYINDKIADAKSMHHVHDDINMDLGKADLTTEDYVAKDNDPFASCQPEVKGR